MASLSSSERASSHDSSGRTFCLVHGAWHGAWCWDLLRPKLEALGHRVLTPNLPITTPEADFDKYAQVVVGEIESSGAKEVDLVGHSMAGNVLPRVPEVLTQKIGKVGIKRLIYIAATIDPQTIGRPLPEEVGKVPDKGSLYYQLLARSRPEGYFDHYFEYIDRESAIAGLYNDCSENLANWAANQLKPQVRRTNPKVREMPNLPSHYLVCARDMMIRTDHQIYMADNWLSVPGNNMSILKSGHSPMLSMPEELARMLSDIAEAA